MRKKAGKTTPYGPNFSQGGTMFTGTTEKCATLPTSQSATLSRKPDTRASNLSRYNPSTTAKTPATAGNFLAQTGNTGNVFLDRIALGAAAHKAPRDRAPPCEVYPSNKAPTGWSAPFASGGCAEKLTRRREDPRWRSRPPRCPRSRPRAPQRPPQRQSRASPDPRAGPSSWL